MGAPATLATIPHRRHTRCVTINTIVLFHSVRRVTTISKAARKTHRRQSPAFLGISTPNNIPSNTRSSVLLSPTPPSPSEDHRLRFDFSYFGSSLNMGVSCLPSSNVDMLGVTATFKALRNAHPRHSSHDCRVTLCPIIGSILQSQPTFNISSHRAVPRRRPRADGITWPNAIVSTRAPRPSGGKTNPLDRFGRIEPLSESGRVDSLWVFSHQFGSLDIPVPVPLALGGEDIGSWFGVVPSVPAGGDKVVLFGPSSEELVSLSTGDIL